MDSKLRLGIIGESPGNGHPFSWSAIFNGYDPTAMEDCGYPAIPRYLERQNWPQARITGATVKSVWTQDRTRSQCIASAARIPRICDTVKEIVEDNDAILLARDDSENHLQYAMPAFQKALPIYIDKPLSCTVSGAKTLFELAGQTLLFSCSALRYDADLNIEAWFSDPRVDKIVGVVPNQWDTYAIHLIEPILASYQQAAGFEGKELLASVGASRVECDSSQGEVKVKWWLPRPLDQGLICTEVRAMGMAGRAIELQAQDAEGRLIDSRVHRDSFSAFKTALQVFTNAIKKDLRPLSQEEMLASVTMVEAGK
ncbi:MAG: Gfo/Idh/MocA family oxidoreductase [Planctomycetota bacterium]|nr:Gfo/Idh/MocA family oxidoreductase [Planctomycetota bacterium]